MCAHDNGVPCTCQLNLFGLHIRDVCEVDPRIFAVAQLTLESQVESRIFFRCSTAQMYIPGYTEASVATDFVPAVDLFRQTVRRGFVAGGFCNIQCAPQTYSIGLIVL